MIVFHQTPSQSHPLRVLVVHLVRLKRPREEKTRPPNSIELAPTAKDPPANRTATWNRQQDLFNKQPFGERVWQ